MPQFQAQGTYAVLIGQSHFEDPDIPDLPAVQANLEDLAQVLSDPDVVGVPQDHIHVVLDAAWAPLLAHECVEAARNATDTLIVYFAGHGFVAGATNSLYLATANSVLRNMAFTGLPFETLRSAILESPARRKVLILDSCYSGRALSAMGDTSSLMEASIDIEGVFSMASASASSTALAPPGERHTAFSGELIRLLREGVESDKPELSLDELFEELKRSLGRKGRPLPQRSASGDAGEFRFARNRGAERLARRRQEALHETLGLLAALCQELILQRGGLLAAQVRRKAEVEDALRTLAEQRVLPSRLLGRAYTLVHASPEELAHDAAYFELLLRLAEKSLSVGDFIEEWGELDRAREAGVRDFPPRPARPAAEPSAPASVAPAPEQVKTASTGTPGLKAEIHLPEPRVVAGQEFVWSVRLENDGDLDFERVSVQSKGFDLCEPFALGRGLQRRLSFAATFSKAGRQTLSAEVKAVAGDGREMRRRLRQVVDVEARPQAKTQPEAKRGVGRTAPAAPGVLAERTSFGVARTAAGEGFSVRQDWLTADYEVSANESHAVPITLRPNDLLEIYVACKPVDTDIAVRIEDPAKRKLLPNLRLQRGSLGLLAAKSGTYRVYLDNKHSTFTNKRLLFSYRIATLVRPAEEREQVYLLGSGASERISVALDAGDLLKVSVQVKSGLFESLDVGVRIEQGDSGTAMPVVPTFKCESAEFVYRAAARVEHAVILDNSDSRWTSKTVTIRYARIPSSKAEASSAPVLSRHDRWLKGDEDA